MHRTVYRDWLSANYRDPYKYHEDEERWRRLSLKKDLFVQIKSITESTFNIFLLVTLRVTYNSTNHQPKWGLRLKPGPEKSGRYSLITGPARLDCDQQQRARSLKSGPAGSPTAQHQRAAFEVMTIDSNGFMDNSPTIQFADNQLSDRPTRRQTNSPKLI